MKKGLFGATIVLSLAFITGSTGNGIKWRDYEDGLKEAKESGKPVFLEFSAEW